jgi:hypothetical protein
MPRKVAPVKLGQEDISAKRIVPFKINQGRMNLVAHACNPSYSGSGDQEHCSLRSVEAKIIKTPSQPIAICKRTIVQVSLGINANLIPQITKAKS